jgi:hypothetical protein
MPGGRIGCYFRLIDEVTRLEDRNLMLSLRTKENWGLDFGKALKGLATI